MTSENKGSRRYKSRNTGQLNLTSANNFLDGGGAFSQKNSFYGNFASSVPASVRQQHRVNSSWMTINVNDYENLSHINMKQEFKKFRSR